MEIIVIVVRQDATLGLNLRYSLAHIKKPSYTTHNVLEHL